jgi:hypothetical protein
MNWHGHCCCFRQNEPDQIMTTPSITSRPGSPPPNIAEAIRHASARTGIGFEYLVDQARIESGFRADAKATTSSATGLYQFTNGTWLSTLKAHGAKHGFGWAADAISTGGKVADPAQRHAILALRNDPALASLMAAEHAGDNKAALYKGTGRAPEDVDLYLAHFLGSAGAVKFLNNWQADPAAPAAPLFPKAAGANRAVFYDDEGRARSLDAIRQRFAAKLGAADAPAQWATAGNRRDILLRPAHSLEMQAIAPMPKGLSLDFAREAYDRLSGGTHR